MVTLLTAIGTIFGALGIIAGTLATAGIIAVGTTAIVAAVAGRVA